MVGEVSKEAAIAMLRTVTQMARKMEGADLLTRDQRAIPAILIIE